MRYVWATLTFYAVALVQTSVMPIFPVLGVSPNLVLIVLVCWTVVRGTPDAMVVIPIGGICLSLMSSEPLGVALLGVLPIVLLAELRALRLTQSDFLLALILVFLSSLAYEVIFLGALRLLGETVVWDQALLRAVLPTGIVSVLFTPPLYWLVWSRSTRLLRARAYA